MRNKREKSEKKYRVLITGASGGIGSSVARKFLYAGHEVAGIDIRDAAVTDPRYTHYICDIRDAEALPDIPGVDILINAAGTQNGPDDIGVNLEGLIAVTERYGVRDGIRSVLNIGSASAHTGSEFPRYVASKGGVMSYTRNVAKRIAPYGATCNSLDPGGVLTELNDPVVNDRKLWNRIMKETPLRRWARPCEIAEWAYFLTAVDSFCTGQCIVVDGGESINQRFVWPE